MQAWTASASNAGALSFFGAGSLLSRVGSDAAYIDEPEEKAIPPLLESRYQEEKIEGLKRTIALITLGKDVSEYFPQVVKNVATPSLEVKKLVYIYLVHYAEKKPDEALLAINSLQKDLSGPDPVVRALALRALTGIRVRVAAPLGVIAVQKCSRDASAYVRRCAAHAVLKLHSLDPIQYGPPMEAVLATLLGDHSPLVVGSAAAALRSVAPEKLGHFARQFPRLCQMLPDLEEWGQIVMLDALLRCAKLRFPPTLSLEKSGVAQGRRLGLEESGLAPEESGSGRGSGEGGRSEAGKGMEEGAVREGLQERLASNDSAQIREEGRYFDPKTGRPLDRRRSGAFEAFQFASVDSFYAESGTEQPGGPNAAESTPLPAIVRQGSATVPASLPQPSVERGADPSDYLPPDLRLLLYCSAPLLMSRNSGVVLAAANLHWHLAPHIELPRVVKPLTFLLRSSPRETQYLALCAISTIARERPGLFRGEFRRFFVRAGDPLFVRELKLDVLATVAGGESVDPILKELQVYSTDADPTFIVLVVRTLGRLARQLPDIAVKCVQGLLSLAVASQKTAGTAGRLPTAEGGPSFAEGTNQGAQKTGQEESSNRKHGHTGTSETAHADVKAAGGASVPVWTNEAAATSGSETAHKPKDPPYQASSSNPHLTGAKEAPLGQHQNDSVVSESISVLCGLVRERPNELESAALRLVAALDWLRVSDGRAAVVALLGDLCGQGGVWTRVTPVVLRFMVGGFAGEEDGVKLAVLELASKYWLSVTPEQRPTEQSLLHHVFTLSRYDSNVDIRDRGRFLRHLLGVTGLGFVIGGTSRRSEPATISGSSAEGNGHEERPRGASSSPELIREDQGLIDRVTDDQPLTVGYNQRLDDPIIDNHGSTDVVMDKQGVTTGVNDEQLVQRILLKAKPAPKPAQIVPDRASFLVGTMSHIVNHTAPGYQALPKFGASLGVFKVESEESTANFDSGKATEETGPASENSEYSGSYGSSNGETEEGSESEAASEDFGSTEGSASGGDGGTEKGVFRIEGKEQTTGGAALSQPSGKTRSSEALTEPGTKERTVVGAEQGKKIGEVGQGNDPKPEGNGKRVGSGVGVQSSAVQDFVGDLLSTDDLENWLGSLTVSEDHKRGEGSSLL